MASDGPHVTTDVTNYPRAGVPGIPRHPDQEPACCGMYERSVGAARAPGGMSNHTIATPITSWAELRATDREVLNRAEVATLLTLDPRTVDHAIDDGTIPAVRVGRRVLIPRRPFLATFGVGPSVGHQEDRDEGGVGHRVEGGVEAGVGVGVGTRAAVTGDAATT